VGGARQVEKKRNEKNEKKQKEAVPCNARTTFFLFEVQQCN
jgi:hypothetical protein